MDQTLKAIVAELKLLRKGSGITLQGLQDSPTILSVTEASHPRKALAALNTALGRMGDTIESKCVRNALNIGGKVRGDITARRLDFERVVARKPDAQRLREDAGFNELAALLVDQPSSDEFDRLVVIASYNLHGHLVDWSIELMNHDFSRGRFLAHEWFGSDESHPSPPIVLYRAERPLWTLKFEVVFREKRPRTYWRAHGKSLTDVLQPDWADKRQVQVQPGNEGFFVLETEFVPIVEHEYYAVCWQW